MVSVRLFLGLQVSPFVAPCPIQRFTSPPGSGPEPRTRVVRLVGCRAALHAALSTYPYGFQDSFWTRYRAIWCPLPVQWGGINCRPVGWHQLPSSGVASAAGQWGGINCRPVGWHHLPASGVASTAGQWGGINCRPVGWHQLPASGVASTAGQWGGINCPWDRALCFGLVAEWACTQGVFMHYVDCGGYSLCPAWHAVWGMFCQQQGRPQLSPVHQSIQEPPHMDEPSGAPSLLSSPPSPIKRYMWAKLMPQPRGSWRPPMGLGKRPSSSANRGGSTRT